MIRRIMLGLVLIIASVNAAFAFKIHNGKLIEHREWTTGDAVVRVKDTTDHDPVNPLKLIFQETKKDSFTENKDGIELHNKILTDGETGAVGTETVINGYVSAYLENFHSYAAKTYKVYSNFCLGENCAKSSYEVQLEPGGYFEFRVKRAVSFNFETPGHYKAVLASLVDGDDLTSVFATIDEGYIEIVN